MKAEEFGQSFDRGEDVTSALDLAGSGVRDRSRAVSMWTFPSCG
jgi:hypothetical protein